MSFSVCTACFLNALTDASVSVRDQTTKAFARETGLTSPDQPYDDCTPAEVDCLQTQSSGSPDISADSISAVLAYLATLEVPESPVPSEQFFSGLKLFTELGCAACHRLELPVDLSETGSGTQTPLVIAPYCAAGACFTISHWRRALSWSGMKRQKGRACIHALRFT